MITQNFHFQAWFQYAKVKVEVIVFEYGTKIDIWEFRLIVFALYIKAITQISLEFSELSLWPDTQSFDIWSIPPRLEVLPIR